MNAGLSGESLTAAFSVLRQLHRTCVFEGMLGGLIIAPEQNWDPSRSLVGSVGWIRHKSAQNKELCQIGINDKR